MIMISNDDSDFIIHLWMFIVVEAIVMSSKHSIMLGTDTVPNDLDKNSNGHVTNGDRILAPRADILAAAIEREQQQSSKKSSSSTSTSTSTHSTSSMDMGTSMDGPMEEESGDVTFVTSVPATKSSASSSTTSSTSSSSSTRVPRPLPQPLLDAAAASASSSSSSSASNTVRTGLSQGSLSRMQELSTTFASLLASANSQAEAIKAVTEQDEKGSASSSTTVGALKPPEVLATCFDLVTSTGSRIALSRIIRASEGGMTTLPSAVKAGQSSSTRINKEVGTIDSFVVLEPIDWTRHHADCTFARLTSINSSADALDNIALDLSQQNDELQSKLDGANRTIESLREQIAKLEKQVKENNTKGQNNASIRSTTTTSASTSSSSSSTASVGRRQKIHESESESEEEEDEEDDMADSEDMHTRTTTTSTSTSAAAASKQSERKTASFSSQS